MIKYLEHHMPDFSFVGAYLWTQEHFEGKNDPFWVRNFQLKFFLKIAHIGEHQIFLLDMH